MIMTDVTLFLHKAKEIVSSFEEEEYSPYARDVLKGVKKLFIIPLINTAQFEVSSALIEDISKDSITLCDVEEDEDGNRYISNLTILDLNALLGLQYEY